MARKKCAVCGDDDLPLECTCKECDGCVCRLCFVEPWGLCNRCANKKVERPFKNRVQLYNPRAKSYVKQNIWSARVMGCKRDKLPYKRILFLDFEGLDSD